MEQPTFTTKERQDIQKLFGTRLEDLTLDAFKKTLKDLRQKYHPDNFEQFENEAVREMATERFQQIEQLSAKMEAWLTNTSLKVPAAPGMEDFMREDAVFAIKKLKIELLTSDKDLKYHLFGTFYRWLQFGDSFKIPGTKASIIIDEDYAGRRIGFQESVRMYLTFGEEDSIEDIVDWLFGKLQGRANSLLIAGNTVHVNHNDMVVAIRRESLLRIGPAVG